jgi:hypothetical protein
MDPQSQNETFNNMINGMVYEYLVDRDKEMNLKPRLAESWTNPEPTKWIFKLRRGVKWHDAQGLSGGAVDGAAWRRQRACRDGSSIRASPAPSPMRNFLSKLVKVRSVIAALVPIAALWVPHDTIAKAIEVTTSTADALAIVAGTVGALGAALATAPQDHK